MEQNLYNEGYDEGYEEGFRNACTRIAAYLRWCGYSTQAKEVEYLHSSQPDLPNEKE